MTCGEPAEENALQVANFRLEETHELQKPSTPRPYPGSGNNQEMWSTMSNERVGQKSPEIWQSFGNALILLIDGDCRLALRVREIGSG